ncbi:MAG: amidase [Deltaproteobacteria bacterium]|nr:amidase [Deltaproteobacteria bacterium]
MSEFAFKSATQLVRDIREGRISSSELLELYLERVERFNPDLNAIVATDIENARAKAKAADKAIANGDKTGPLHGLPITIKDTLEVKGMPCTSGAPLLKNHMPANNADVVQSLIDAGAIVFGKTNVPLYGGDMQSFNDVYGTTNNPWDLKRTPGGSSGGAAASLSAGLCGLDMGSDIGGSIRTPSHFCGLYGHKPSFGIVPDRGHVPPPPGIFTGDHSMVIDIVTVGPLARSIDDISLAMELVVAPEKSEQKAWRIELPEPRKKLLADYRIGFWFDDPVCPVDGSISDILQGIADDLSTHGVKIEEKHPDIDFAGTYDVFLSLLAAVMGAGAPSKLFDKWLSEAMELAFDDQSYMAKNIRGATQLHNSWIRVDVVRQIIRQKWSDFFREFDVLLCPVAPVTAIPHDHNHIYDRKIIVNGAERPYPDLMGWASLAGVACLPATVVPAGRTPEGLPVGIQIIGPYLEDKTPIHVAKLMEDISDGFVPPPGY